MDGKPVIAIEDITGIAFEPIRPGCEKAVLQQDAEAQAGVFRIQPRGTIPLHRHSRARDLFIGVKGEVDIRHESGGGTAVFTLKPGAFCSVAPGVRHEVSNASSTEEAVFVLVHAPYEGFDIS